MAKVERGRAETTYETEVHLKTMKYYLMGVEKKSEAVGPRLNHAAKTRMRKEYIKAIMRFCLLKMRVMDKRVRVPSYFDFLLTRICG